MNQSGTKAKPNRKKITKQVVVSAKPAEKWNLMVWDTEVKGFGLEVRPSGHKAYVFRYRNRSGRERQFHLGTHPKTTAAEARSTATIKAGEVERGIDIVEEELRARRAGTVRELVDEFLEIYVDGDQDKADNTKREHRRSLEKHVVPKWGSRTPDDITMADVKQLKRSLRETPYLANRLLAVVSKMMNWAIEEGIRTDPTNPCSHVTKYPIKAHEKRLHPDDLGRLGEALLALEEHGPDRRGAGDHPIKRSAEQERSDRDAAAAIRLLLFTGCRLNEILSLKWEHVDLENQVLELPKTKTGSRTVLLSAPATAVLSARKKTGSEYVFPGKSPDAPRKDALKRPWDWIREQAKLKGIRLHTLRHTFGSFGGDANLSLVMIAHLLGHKQTSTAERYIKLDKDPVRRAADRVAGEIAASLNGQNGEVVPLEKV